MILPCSSKVPWRCTKIPCVWRIAAIWACKNSMKIHSLRTKKPKRSHSHRCKNSKTSSCHERDWTWNISSAGSNVSVSYAAPIETGARDWGYDLTSLLLFTTLIAIYERGLMCSSKCLALGAAGDWRSHAIAVRFELKLLSYFTWVRVFNKASSASL